MQDITFVTGNKHKLTEMERILGVILKSEDIDLPEIQSLSLEEVAIEKAKQAFAIIQSPVIVEDISFVIHQFGKLPGPFIKWFMSEIGDTGLCHLIQKGEDRSVTTYACLVYYDGKDTKVFTGECHGSLAESPRSGEGFGFDFMFIPEGYDTTWSEMTREAKDSMSHRAQAAQKFRDYLKDEARDGVI